MYAYSEVCMVALKFSSWCINTTIKNGQGASQFITMQGGLTMLDKTKGEIVDKFFDFMLVLLLLAFIANLIHGAI